MSSKLLGKFQAQKSKSPKFPKKPTKPPKKSQNLSVAQL
jgi:hypothetical protein